MMANEAIFKRRKKKKGFASKSRRAVIKSLHITALYRAKNGFDE